MCLKVVGRVAYLPSLGQDLLLLLREGEDEDFAVEFAETLN